MPKKLQAEQEAMQSDRQEEEGMEGKGGKKSRTTTFCVAAEPLALGPPF